MDFKEIEFKEIYNKNFYRKKDLEMKKLITDNEIEELKNQIDIIQRAQILIQDIAQKTQSNIVIHIENIVDKALETVFGDEYKFKFEFEQKRGKVEVNYFLLRKDGSEIDIMNGAGGGVIDIVSFALRIAVWTISNNVENVVILDEPFRFLSQDLQDRAGEILKELSVKLGIQFIIVSHNEKLISYADKIFFVKKSQNFSFLT